MGINREQCLQLLMLFSALESWSYSTGSKLPEYLHNELSSAIEILRKEVLK